MNYLLSKITVSEVMSKKVLDMTGLQEYRYYYPKKLSTSMLQRVVIARAFAVEPELLLV